MFVVVSPTVPHFNELVDHLMQQGVSVLVCRSVEMFANEDSPVTAHASIGLGVTKLSPIPL
jgi:predicted peroxiredoxin